MLSDSLQEEVGRPGDFAPVERLSRDAVELSGSALVTHTFLPGCRYGAGCGYLPQPRFVER
jgi:hypothetical protein